MYLASLFLAMRLTAGRALVRAAYKALHAADEGGRPAELAEVDVAEAAFLKGADSARRKSQSAAEEAVDLAAAYEAPEQQHV